MSFYHFPSGVPRLRSPCLRNLANGAVFLSGATRRVFWVLVLLLSPGIAEDDNEAPRFLNLDPAESAWRRAESTLFQPLPGPGNISQP